MLGEKEYSVCLIRLKLPHQDLTSKLTLSVQNSSSQIFICKEKGVKQQKVHFYRQTIFLDSISQGITFKVYSTSTPRQRNLIQSFQISAQELTSIDKRAAMFHTKRNGYELVWECCVFKGTSEFDNDQTDREYSEFKNYFDSDLQLISQKSRTNSKWGCKDLQDLNKRSTSAESSSFRNSNFNNADCQGSGITNSKRGRGNPSSPQRSQSGKENKELRNTKLNKFFSIFQGGISSLFSSTNI